MITLQAKTVNDLLSKLQDLEEEGQNLHQLTWYGSDDCSLLLVDSDGLEIVAIEPKEDLE